MPRRRVVIIGGGVAGTAVFAALARAGVDADIVDPLPPGSGTAFGVRDPALLCNTSAGLMSLLPGLPDDFARARGAPADGEAFAPRAEFARYLRDVYESWAGRPGGTHRRVARRAVAVQPLGERDGYRVLLEGGAHLPADDVLVCLGWGPPLVPAGLRGRPGIVPSPFPEGRMLEAVPPSGRVLVLGTRLSAIDAVLLLTRHGHRVTMASPSGELPAVRTRTVRGAVRIDPALVAALDPADPQLTRHILHLVTRTLGTALTCANGGGSVAERLRSEVEAARRGRVGWQDVLVELVDLANPLLVRRDGEARRRVLRACEPLMRYLGSFPLPNAERLLGLLESGQVRVRAGVPRRLDGGVPRRLDGSSPWRVEWPDGSSEGFDAVVCATGFTARRPHLRNGALMLTSDAAGAAGAPLELDADLRLRMDGRTYGRMDGRMDGRADGGTDGRSERIWLLGVSSGPRVPFVNAVHHATDQAEAFVRAFSGSPPASPEPGRPRVE
ncbi:FAD-dependent oxidoreductase [Actinomadura logoneensis]|uniref:FAD-dependent oxidoreductase n=1 Tax=Actinomadura logoneensis TaxID=2293572 RepID=A0A372JC64_9ACTN|nr:FAD/NAD(P)-binding protein [Actinomadura logoneensis]RFU37601.1 FAD-dependent oxidoreductase [Actinomadura logoneensis]